MAGTRWKSTIRESVGLIYRELKVTVTPIPRPQKWVFIVGCYNSGTTLLSEVLGTHDMISALQTEGQYLTDQFASDHELGLSRMWTRREDLYRLTENDKGPDVVRIKKEWGMSFDQTKPVLLEKTPANAARTRWLQKHFENAYFIGVIRNGYAAAEGISRKAMPIHMPGGWPIHLSAYQWTRSNMVIEADSKYLRHFIWVRYEDLANATGSVLESIFRFLDISGKAGVNLQRTWRIHERNQTIKNLNDESIRRLSSEDIKLISEVAGDALSHFGYDLISSRTEK